MDGKIKGIISTDSKIQGAIRSVGNIKGACVIGSGGSSEIDVTDTDGVNYILNSGFAKDFEVPFMLDSNIDKGYGWSKMPESMTAKVSNEVTFDENNTLEVIVTDSGEIQIVPYSINKSFLPDLITNRDYVFSFYLKKIDAGKNDYIRVSFNDTTERILCSSEWTKVIVKFPKSGTAETISSDIHIRFLREGTYYIANVKFETGLIATKWCPSFDDFESGGDYDDKEIVQGIVETSSHFVSAFGDRDAFFYKRDNDDKYTVYLSKNINLGIRVIDKLFNNIKVRCSICFITNSIPISELQFTLPCSIYKHELDCYSSLWFTGNTIKKYEVIKDFTDTIHPLLVNGVDTFGNLVFDVCILKLFIHGLTNNDNIWIVKFASGIYAYINNFVCTNTNNIYKFTNIQRIRLLGTSQSLQTLVKDASLKGLLSVGSAKATSSSTTVDYSIGEEFLYATKDIIDQNGNIVFAKNADIEDLI